jgi:histidyl-tRNA synthetase
MLLKSENSKAGIPRGSEVAVLTFGREESVKGFDYARRLRKAGVSTYVDVMERNMRNKMKHAARIGAKISLIIGMKKSKRYSDRQVMSDGRSYS